MTATQLDQNQQQKISIKMRAILCIISSDSILMDAALPHIDFKSENIDWRKISEAPLNPSQRGACLWAGAIWADEIGKQASLFDVASSIEPNLQAGILKALKHLWGIRG